MGVITLSQCDQYDNDQASSVESFLILFSSFQKDVTLPPSPKLLGTTNKLFSGYQHVKTLYSMDGLMR